jgi:hypothetical protein
MLLDRRSRNSQEPTRTPEGKAEHTRKIENVPAWRRQAAILRREITQSKRKSFKYFISHINYEKDSQKTCKYPAIIQNNSPCSNKVAIHENNDIITSERKIANTFACTFSRAQKKVTHTRKKSKIFRGEYKNFKPKNGSDNPTTEGKCDLPISNCELQEAIKQL